MSKIDVGDDRRQFWRKNTEIPAVLQVDNEIHGHVVNASLGGFLFWPNTGAVSGQKGHLKLRDGAFDVPITVVNITENGTHLRLEATDDVYVELAAESDEIAALLIAATLLHKD